MSRTVKASTTTVSSKNQVTIPVAELRNAGIGPGDIVRVETTGAGQVLLTRVDELLARYRGAINSGGELRNAVAGLRDEWR